MALITCEEHSASYGSSNPNIIVVFDKGDCPLCAATKTIEELERQVEELEEQIETAKEE